MSGKLFVHIGVHKTGSTSIQQSFFRSRKILAEHGIGYYDYTEAGGEYGARGNHSALIYWLFSKNRAEFAATARKKLTKEKLTSEVGAIEKSFRQFLGSNNYGIKIVSGEAISLLEPEAVAEFRKYLIKFSQAPVRIIAYVRNYYEFMDSVCQQRIKGGAPLASIAAALEKGQPILSPRYKFRIEKFRKIFGAENVDVRVFDRECFWNGDLLQDFCKSLGIERNYPELVKIRANESISQASFEAINIYNGLYPFRQGKQYNDNRSSRIRKYLEKPGEPRFRLMDEKLLRDFDRSTQEDKQYMKELLGERAEQYLLGDRRARQTPASQGNDNGATTLGLLARAMGELVRDIDGYDRVARLLIGLLGPDPEVKDLPAEVGATMPLVNLDHLCTMLARAFVKKGDLGAAQLAAQRAVEIDGSNAANHLSLGLVYRTKEEWEAAIGAYQSALLVEPTNTAARRHLSYCSRQLSADAA